MRQVIVKVPSGYGKEVIELAVQHQGINNAQVGATDGQKDYDLVFLYIPNQEVGSLLQDLDSQPELSVTIFPHSVLTMTPPKAEVSPLIKEVTHRSPIEVWLSGLQSIGSWKGFLGYTLAAGVIVWIGLFTDTIYLLVAAMLIAPFAGPAMNTAIATASGDLNLLWRNLLRYAISLGLTIVITCVISLLIRAESVTPTMVSVSEISSLAVLLPLVAGAAGALNLVLAENNSLVSGTAVGLLIAASLAPPAGLIGMSAALSRWDMAQNGVFLLLLQLVGINLAGSIVFRAYGLKTTRKRYERGKQKVFYISIAATLALIAGLMFWQFSTSPHLQRASRSQQAVGEVQKVVTESRLAELVEANLRFTRPSIQRQNMLLGVIYVQRLPGVALSNSQIQQELTHRIQQRLLDQGFNVEPLIDVNVLEPLGLQP